MRKRFIVLLVIASILLTFSLFLFLTVVLPFDINAYRESINNSTKEADSVAEGIATGLGVGLAAGLGLVAIIIVNFLSIIAGVVSIPFSIGMIKAEKKAIKIMGIVYVCVGALIVIIDIVKFISWII